MKTIHGKNEFHNGTILGKKLHKHDYRNGERIQDMKFFEDKVKAVPRGNAYCIGNGPSRKGF